MKTSLTQKREHQTLIDADRTQEMMLDPESAKFLMHALSNMYTNPAYSVLQEYLSNALDAHEDVETSFPIKVKLPSSNHPILVVRDYGPGVSLEKFKTVISRYGASTSRDTNQKRGGFGLGMKSGYAVTDKFTVKSFQNGTQLIVDFCRTSAGLPYLTFHPETRTLEENGLEVSITIPKKLLPQIEPSTLEQAGFFTALNPEQVTFEYNEQPYDYAEYSGYTSNRFTAVQDVEGTLLGWVEVSDSSVRNWKSCNRASIGGITLPSDITLPGKRLLSNARTILNLPIGTVEIAHSRDQLVYSTQTQDTLEAVYEEFQTYYHDMVMKEINQLSPYEAFTKGLNFYNRSYANTEKLVYHGKKFHPRFPPDPENWRIYVSSPEFPATNSKLETIWLASISKAVSPEHFLVVTCDNTSQANRVKRNIKLYMKAVGWQQAEVITLRPTHDLVYWFGSINQTITYDKFMEEVKKSQPSHSATTPRLTEMYPLLRFSDLQTSSQQTVTVKQVSADSFPTKLFYLDSTQTAKKHALASLVPKMNKSTGTGTINLTSHIKILLALKEHLGEDVGLVFLIGNRVVRKLKTAAPHITPFADEVQKFMDTQVTVDIHKTGNLNLLESYLRMKRRQSVVVYQTSNLRLLEPNTPQIPEDLKVLLELLTSSQEPTVPMKWLQSFGVDFNQHKQHAQFNIQSLLNKYPLLFGRGIIPDNIKKSVYRESLLNYITMCDTLNEGS